MKIRYSEIFTSFQGEAEYTGMPSVWVRFFGCNLQCNGFGQEDPTNPKTYELPYKTIDVSAFKSMNDLPVLSKGCDSGYSWSSRFKSLAYNDSEQNIATLIRKKAREELGLDIGSWYHSNTGMPVQLCFTGGEPMLYQKAMLAILKELQDLNEGMKLPQITIETNGTKKVDPDIFTEIRSCVRHIHFAVSPKLFSVSGEKNAFNLSVIRGLQGVSDSIAVKFVINGTEASWKELETYEAQMREFPSSRTPFWAPPAPSLWVMPVGATVESQRESSVEAIAKEAMRRGYRVAARVHCYVFGNKMST